MSEALTKYVRIKNFKCQTLRILAMYELCMYERRVLIVEEVRARHEEERQAKAAGLALQYDQR